MNVFGITVFGEAENKLVEYIKQVDVVSIEHVQEVTNSYPPKILKSEREIKVSRFGIRFASRISFSLRDTVIDMGDYYMFTNTFFLDFIDDITLAATSNSSVLSAYNNIKIVLDKPTPVPMAHNFSWFTFKKGDLDIDTKLTGVIFGNRVRLLMNTRQKALGSHAVVTMFTFPYIEAVN
jgi:hypothetical protein